MAKFTTNEIVSIIDKEARDLGLFVIVHERLPLELYFEYGSKCIAYTCTDFSIHVFIEPLKSMVNMLNAMEGKLGKFAKFTNWGRSSQKTFGKIIRKTLVHEARHAEQFKYLQERGIDPANYLLNQSKTYWFRRHELDAYLVQYTGIRLPLKWVFGV